MSAMKERMQLYGYDLQEHMDEVKGKKPSSSVEPKKDETPSKAEMRKAVSQSVVETKKDVPIPRQRSSNASVPSDGKQSRAQRNEQKYSSALKSAMKVQDDNREKPQQSPIERKIQQQKEMKEAAIAKANQNIRPQRSARGARPAIPSSQYSSVASSGNNKPAAGHAKQKSVSKMEDIVSKPSPMKRNPTDKNLMKKAVVVPPQQQRINNRVRTDPHNKNSANQAPQLSRQAQEARKFGQNFMAK